MGSVFPRKYVNLSFTNYSVQTYHPQVYPGSTLRIGATHDTAQIRTNLPEHSGLAIMPGDLPVERMSEGLGVAYPSPTIWSQGFPTDHGIGPPVYPVFNDLVRFLEALCSYGQLKSCFVHFRPIPRPCWHIGVSRLSIRAMQRPPRSG